MGHKTHPCSPQRPFNRCVLFEPLKQGFDLPALLLEPKDRDSTKESIIGQDIPDLIDKRIRFSDDPTPWLI